MYTLKFESETVHWTGLTKPKLSRKAKESKIEDKTDHSKMDYSPS